MDNFDIENIDLSLIEATFCNFDTITPSNIGSGYQHLHTNEEPQAGVGDLIGQHWDSFLVPTSTGDSNIDPTLAKSQIDEFCRQGMSDRLLHQVQDNRLPPISFLVRTVARPLRFLADCLCRTCAFRRTLPISIQYFLSFICQPSGSVHRTVFFFYQCALLEASSLVRTALSTMESAYMND